MPIEENNKQKRFFPKLKATGIKSLKWPSWSQWKKILGILSNKDKIFIGIFLVSALISLIALALINKYKNSQKVAAPGGEYTEGAIGQPQYINPALASASDIDSDIVELVFSGLFKHSQDGKIINDLASSYEISEDKKTYSIIIREDAQWHDGEKLDAKDVAFTVQTIANPAYKSPLQQSLQSVECQTDGDYKIRFILKEPYAPFLHNLTFKIMPVHIWQNTPPTSFRLFDGNLKPIGSGIFEFKNLAKDKDGFIHSITLEKFENYHQEKPLIELVTFKFYQNESGLLEAYNKKEILGISEAPKKYEEKLKDLESVEAFQLKLPQYFAIFLNQESNKALKDKNIRIALAKALNKNSLVSGIFEKEAEKIDSCIPYLENETYKRYDFSPQEAASILESAGWKDSDNDGIRESASSKLEFSLATADQPQLVSLAQLIKSQWENIGVKINLNIKNVSELQTIAIRNRDYDMLIFGQSLERDPDPYAFWHSSQKDYPGLNLAMFSNPEADKILEAIRGEFDASIKIEDYKKLQNIISEEIPAIFLFSLNRTYLISDKVKNTEAVGIALPQNRFDKINNWYIKTKYEGRNKNASSSN